jgi:hypothetical protein
MSKLKDIVKSVAKKSTKESNNATDPSQLGQSANRYQVVGEDEVVGAHGVLGRYLKTRGVDPRYVTRNKRISFSKTNQFKKWAALHQFDKDKPVQEDTFADPQAATQTPSDNSDSRNDAVISEKKKQRSKSARMIKALYKRHGVKEDMYDHEKEDKSVQTYGKKTKSKEGEGIKGDGEGGEKAKMVITLGTPLTKSKSPDIVEIEPPLKRPNSFDASVEKKNKKSI